MSTVSFGSSAISPMAGVHVSRVQVRPVFMGNGSLTAVLKHLAAQPRTDKANLERGDAAPAVQHRAAKPVMMGAGYCPAAIRHLEKQR